MSKSTDLEKKPGLIRRFFRLINKLVSGLRSFINLAVLVLFLVFIASLFQEDIQPLPEKAALRLALEGVLVDQKTYSDPFSQALSQGGDKVDAETLLSDVIEAINQAATDKRIIALVLNLSDFKGGGLSKLEEVGQALDHFKATDKPIIAVGDTYNQTQYYLASFADEIHLNPMGSVDLIGFGSYPSYFKNALDKLKITVNIFRVGQYKDAIEPFSRDSMSQASKEHTQVWLTSLWQLYTSKVEQLRNLPTDAINDYVNNLDTKLAAQGGDGAILAKQSGLVDHLSTRPQMLDRLILLAGAKDDNYQHINFKSYISHIKRSQLLSKATTDDDGETSTIGIIVAKGTILDGQQPQGNIGGDSLSALLKEAEKANLKALIIRIDSPGGSAFASEVIRQQILRIQDKNIPVVVSMGSVAASGGYWIAANADEIWANSSTITGSIGVFGIIPTVDKSLQHIGITSDGVGTTDIADIMHLDRPMSDKAKSLVQQSVDNIYRQFITQVANARSSSPEAIHEIAQGRVWTGIKAQELGLIDKLGTLQDAIDGTAKLAKLTNYKVQYIEPPMNFYEQLLQKIAQGGVKLVAKTDITQWLGSSQQTLQLLQPSLEKYLAWAEMLNDPEHLYLQCFECAQ